MRFASPLLGVLAGCAALACCAAWVVFGHRSRRSTLQFSDLRLLVQAAPRRTTWRRRVLGVATVAAAALAAVAAAGPQLRGPATSEAARVVLVLDTSGSMNANDIAPSRLDAARGAAAAFARAAPAGVEVSVVSFASGAFPVLAPTTDMDMVVDALGTLYAEGGTAAGEGIFAGLNMLETAGWDITDSGPVQLRTGTLVVLADGETNAGRDPILAAEVAAASAVTIHTVAFGTSEGRFNGEPVGVDIELMEQIAAMTGGTASQATSGAELAEVFADLGRSTRVVYGWQSVSHWFAAAAVAVISAGSIVGLARRARIT